MLTQFFIFVLMCFSSFVLIVPLYLGKDVNSFNYYFDIDYLSCIHTNPRALDPLCAIACYICHQYNLLILEDNLCHGATFWEHIMWLMDFGNLLCLLWLYHSFYHKGNFSQLVLVITLRKGHTFFYVLHFVHKLGS